jgi:hypothetical protein
MPRSSVDAYLKPSTLSFSSAQDWPIKTASQKSDGL